MKKKTIKLLATVLMLATFMSGCSSPENTDSAATNSADTQIEAEAPVTEETSQTESAEIEETIIEEESVPEETNGLDIESLAAEMGYTEFLLYKEDEKVFAYRVPEGWVKDTEIDAKNYATYTTVYPEQVRIWWDESEKFENLPESFIEHTNNEEPTDYYKSKEAELICELDVPAYGTSYLFHTKSELADSVAEYSNSYEVIIPCNGQATSISLNMIYSEQEKNISGLKTVIEQLFGNVEQNELSEDYANYIQSSEGVKLLGYNLPEGYELNPTSTDESRQQMSYKNSEKILTIYPSFSGDMMDSLYDSGHLTEEITGKKYTEKDSVETAYGTVKLYEVTTIIDSDLNLMWREEMALVKSKGQLFIVLYGNLEEDYYTNASATDEWKGDIKTIITGIF